MPLSLPYLHVTDHAKTGPKQLQHSNIQLPSPRSAAAPLVTKSSRLDALDAATQRDGTRNLPEPHAELRPLARRLPEPAAVGRGAKAMEAGRRHNGTRRDVWKSL